MEKIINREEIEGRIAVTEAAINRLELSGEKNEAYMNSLVNARDYWKHYLETYYD